jgi:hypothetical protein
MHFFVAVFVAATGQEKPQFVVLHLVGPDQTYPLSGRMHRFSLDSSFCRLSAVLDFALREIWLPRMDSDHE